MICGRKPTQRDDTNAMQEWIQICASSVQWAIIQRFVWAVVSIISNLNSSSKHKKSKRECRSRAYVAKRRKIQIGRHVVDEFVFHCFVDGRQRRYTAQEQLNSRSTERPNDRARTSIGTVFFFFFFVCVTRCSSFHFCFLRLPSSSLDYFLTAFVDLFSVNLIEFQCILVSIAVWSTTDWFIGFCCCCIRLRRRVDSFRLFSSSLSSSGCRMWRRAHVNNCGFQLYLLVSVHIA